MNVIPYILLKNDFLSTLVGFMLDSGSEINIIRIGYIANRNMIDKNKKILITGICKNSVLSLGQINKKVLGIDIDFVVVPDNFQIPFAGILGSQLFLENKTKIDFANQTFSLGNKLIKFFQDLGHSYKLKDSMNINMTCNQILNCLPFIGIYNPLLKNKGYFMIDTGSEANIIKIKLIPEKVKINTSQRESLRGIKDEAIKSLGTIEINIHKVKSLFYVMPNDFYIPCDGIIGSTYLTQAKALINFEDKCLNVGNSNSPLKFLSMEKITEIYEEKLESSNISVKSNNSMNVNFESTIEEIDEQLSQINTEYCTSQKVIENFYDTNKIEILENQNILERNFKELTTNHVFKIAYQETFDDLGLTLESKDLNLDLFELCHHFDNHEYSEVAKIFDISLENSSVIDRLRLEHLNDEEKENIKNLISKHEDRFLLKGQHLGAASTVMHKIVTIDEIPINIKQYKFPFSLKDEVNKQVEELLEAGIIKPSSSPYNATLWMVPKKIDASGIQKWRLVSDFRALNEKTITDAYPLPDINQIIDQVGGHKYYTVLDLASGFHQILMDPKDSHKTAFSTPYGHYEYIRMTFGLKNAPPTFQRYIDETFKGLQGKILFSFIDDIVIFADSLEEHEEKLNLVMERLRQSNLQLNIDKCEFLKSSVCYLGHILSIKGVSPDPKKIEAVKNFPQPTTVKGVR